MTQYKYVHTYKDRHGHIRHYFRRKGVRVRLPDDIESEEFKKIYKNAFAEPASIREKRVQEHYAKLEKEEHLRTLAERKRPVCGVYLLILNDEIVYVGSSKNMRRRVNDHRSNGRPFDRVFFIGTAEHEREPLEATIIRQLRPAQNRVIKRIGNGRVALDSRNLAHQMITN